jgi:putative ABC transport system permease protein
VDSLVQDARFGLRMLRKNLGFTVVAVIVLGVGIGATTAIFSVVDAVLLRPLPFAGAHRLVLVQNNYRNFGNTPTSYPQFLYWRDQHQIFENVITSFAGVAALTGNGEPEQVRTLRLSAGFLPALGLSPALGRSFRDDEEPRSAEPVAMLSHKFWQSRFHSSPTVLGQKLTLADRVYTVVGVLPAEFHFGRNPDVVFPLRVDTNSAPAGLNFLDVIAKLRPGVELGTARSAIQAVLPTYKKDDADINNIALTPYQDFLSGNSRPLLLVLLGGVAAVLLIACSNIANLLLARAAAREKEMAIRISLGAGRMRLTRQLLTESAVLGIAGGSLGVLMAWAGLDVLVTLLARRLPGEIAIHLDARVLVFAAVISLITSIVFGLAPVLQAAGGNLHDRLKQGGRQEAGGSQRLRQALVVCEIAFSLVLLSGAGLLVRSMLRLINVEKGFSTDHILTMSIEPSPVRYSEPRKELAYIQQIQERVSSVPGVRSAGFIYMVPLEGGQTNGGVKIEGHQADSSAQPNAYKQYVAGEFFAAMKIPLLKGRLFQSMDTTDSAKVVIINQAFARRYFPGEDPVGKRIDVGWGNPGWSEIIGVVGDSKLENLAAPASPTTYMLYAQVPEILKFLGFSLVLRTSQEPLSAVQAIRNQIHHVDANQPIAEIRTMDQVLAESLAPQRAPLWLFGAFSGIALFLAAIGIYGVLSYFVVQHSQEIGVRMAIGAPRSKVVGLVIGRGARLIAIGVGLGVIAALIASRTLSSLLFGVKPTDAPTFALVAVFLALLGLMACVVPAHRATRVDPLVVLRNE